MHSFSAPPPSICQKNLAVPGYLSKKFLLTNGLHGEWLGQEFSKRLLKLKFVSNKMAREICGNIKSVTQNTSPDAIRGHFHEIANLRHTIKLPARKEVLLNEETIFTLKQ